MIIKTTISKLKKGTLFTFKTVESDWTPSHTLYIRGEYKRSTKTYQYLNYIDLKIAGEISGTTVVYI